MIDRVTLLLRGRLLERFVERALQEGVHLQEIERVEPREMKICASEQEARILLRLAEEYRMDLTVAGEAGKPCWKRKLRGRATLLPGILMGALMIAGFTARIWRVEVVSLDGMAGGELLSAIEQSAAEWGAVPGTLIRDVDRDRLAMDIQVRWPELTHVSVRQDGVFLRVEVALEEAAPEVYDVSASRDLVAARDAIVVHVEPLAGKANVKPGDTVRRGQVLIRGEERIDTDVTRGIRALGQVIGKVWFTAECELPLSETVRTRTGNRRVSSELRLGGWSLALSEVEDYSCQEIETEYLPVGGMYLPIRIVRTIRWEAEERTVGLDRENQLRQGEAWAMELAREKLPAGAEETAGWVDFREKDGRLIAQATLEAQMDIASDRAQLKIDHFE